MKKNSLKNLIVAHAVASLVLPAISFAGIVGIRESGNKSGPGGPGGPGGPEGGPGKPPEATSNITIKEGTPLKADVKMSEGEAGVTCSHDANSSTYFPLDFFKEISKDGSTLSFEARDNNKIMVNIPATLDVCGKFKPRLYQDEKTKNVTIMMVNDQGKNYGEYLKCLEAGGYLKDGKLDHTKIENKNYSEYSYVLDYNFDKKREVTQSMKLSFGYPISMRDEYKYRNGLDKDVDLSRTGLCMEAEKVAADPVYLNEGRDVLLQRLNKLCKDNDAQKIAEARKSIGNADALKDIADKIKAELDTGYLKAVLEKDVPRIFADMAKLDDKIAKDYKTMDEQKAKKLTKEYADLAKELDSKFLNPAIYRLDSLMKKRQAMEEESPERSKLDDEIKALNEQIGQFAAIQAKTPAKNLYGLLEKFSFSDSAKTLEDIRLKSLLYSRVYAAGGPGGRDDKRGKALSFEEANQKQVKLMGNFEKTLGDWEDVYLVGKGSTVPIKKVEAARTSKINQMNNRWNSYLQNEQKQYSQYCSVGMTGSITNPVACQNFTKGISSRREAELKRRKKDLASVDTYNGKLSKMGYSYNEYQTKEREKAKREDDSNDPYGAGGGSERDFDSEYPQYTAPTGTTSYTEWLASNQTTNMGVQSSNLQTAYSGNSGVTGTNGAYAGYSGTQGNYQYQMPQTGYTQANSNTGYAGYR